MVDVVNDPTSCPNCGTTASGTPAILSVFGLRNMGDDTRRVQSWCRECRIKQKEVLRIARF